MNKRQRERRLKPVKARRYPDPISAVNELGGAQQGARRFKLTRVSNFDHRRARVSGSVPELLLSQYFAEMRVWLDAHNITPIYFRLFGGPIVGLEVRFSSPEQAALFDREFGPKYQPSTVVRLIFAGWIAQNFIVVAQPSTGGEAPATCETIAVAKLRL